MAFYTDHNSYFLFNFATEIFRLASIDVTVYFCGDYNFILWILYVFNFNDFHSLQVYILRLNVAVPAVWKQMWVDGW